MARVYCAGPLFCPGEQDEMKEIADALREEHEVFLPQEHGLEKARLARQQGIEEEVLDRAIFHLDVFKVLEWSDAIVANLNGRVPDEGTIVEIALAWHASKGVVIVKTDSDSPSRGLQNPMVVGLSGFQLTTSVGDVNDAVRRALQQKPSSTREVVAARGRQLHDLLEKTGNRADEYGPRLREIVRGWE